LISNTKGKAYTGGVSKQGAERIFGPKRDELMAEWRKLHNGELHNLY
jgi:hypothetical protein